MKTCKATRISLICAGRSAGVHTSTFGNLGLLPGEEVRIQQALASISKTTTPIVSAPEENALQTASMITGTFEVEEALAELDYGRWKGATLQAIAAAEPENSQAWLTDPSLAPHGGETIVALLERARIWLGAQMERGGRHVVIANQSMVRALILGVIEAPAQSFWRLEVAPLSTTEMSSDGQRWTIRTMGAVAGTG